MSIKVGINGFGRIGRTLFRQILKNPSLNYEVVALNDLAPPVSLAHLLKYDSVHGPLQASVSVQENALIVNDKKIPVFSWKNPQQSEWGKLGIQIVLECSGFFTDKESCQGHFKDGVQKVIISAPAKGVDATLVRGVNCTSYDPKLHHLISNASCTTNCLAPLVKVLHENFKVKRGFMTTVHSYTNDQKILDLPHKDLRRARAAAVSQIPTSTGAAKAIGLVIPELKGKIDGFAVRVPTPNVSLVDFVCEVEKNTHVEAVNTAFKKASEAGSLKNILAYSEEPLVSIDYNGNPHSSTIDAELTSVMDGTLLKVVSWYDNETGFSQRMVELTELVAKQL
ncbi:MAG: type I glyceraldehyde-3-phosphate dehydrogenase [Deltaproteobacteria bacterium]|nr:type I glyceraldehyde-3-phosphate dehydrogenase [Deltaproteobacteria bacterium]